MRIWRTMLRSWFLILSVSGAAADSNTMDFNGVWVEGPIEMTIVVTDKRVTGQFKNGSFRSDFIGEVIDEDTLLLKNDGGGRTKFALRLTSVDTLEGNWSESGGFSGEISLTRVRTNESVP